MSAKSILIFPTLALFGLALGHAAEQSNVLFIAVDDLRPELGLYGVERAITPHLDRLGSEGVFFTSAYCNSPQCGPSRASVLTGLRSNRDRFFTRGGIVPSGNVETEAAGIPTLPGLFKKAGYQTACLGKIYHHFGTDPESWTIPAWRVGEEADWHRIPENFHTPEGRASLRRLPNGRTTSVPWEAADVSDNAYPDGLYADKAIELLEQFKDDRKSFFLAVGFLRPHLPLNAPQRYWDLYPEASIELPDWMRMPEGAPRQAAYNWPELRSYVGIPKKGPLSEAQARTLIRAYLACVSYVDAQIGRVLDALDRLGLAEDTIVVVWGDHGWNLGEHGFWCKHTTFETSMRVPLIFRGPGVAEGASDALVELVDLYPTLLELTGISMPDHVEGTSLRAQLEDPATPGRDFALGYWRQADTVKSADARLSVWSGPNGQHKARMLYDHSLDPDETRNVADDPRYRETLELLREQMPNSAVTSPSSAP
jgi:arylsulfatase A-like enzyme